MPPAPPAPTLDAPTNDSSILDAVRLALGAADDAVVAANHAATRYWRRSAIARALYGWLLALSQQRMYAIDMSAASNHHTNVLRARLPHFLAAFARCRSWAQLVTRGETLGRLALLRSGVDALMRHCFWRRREAASRACAEAARLQTLHRAMHTKLRPHATSIHAQRLKIHPRQRWCASGLRFCCHASGSCASACRLLLAWASRCTVRLFPLTVRLLQRVLDIGRRVKRLRAAVRSWRSAAILAPYALLSGTAKIRGEIKAKAVALLEWRSRSTLSVGRWLKWAAELQGRRKRLVQRSARQNVPQRSIPRASTRLRAGVTPPASGDTRSGTPSAVGTSGGAGTPSAWHRGARMRWEVACSAMEDEAAAIAAAAQRLEVARAAETARRILAYDGHASGYSRSSSALPTPLPTSLPTPQSHASAPTSAQRHASATEHSPPPPSPRASQDVSPSYTPPVPPLPVYAPPPPAAPTATGASASSLSSPASFAAIPPHIVEQLSAGQLDARGRLLVQLSAEDLAELRRAADGMSTWSPITGVEQDARMPTAPVHGRIVTDGARMHDPMHPSYSSKLLRSPGETPAGHVAAALKKAATTKQSPLAPPAASARGHAAAGGLSGWLTLSP